MGWAACDAASSSSRGSGRGPSGMAPRLGGSTWPGHQARPEEAQEASWGTGRRVTIDREELPVQRLNPRRVERPPRRVTGRMRR